MLSKSRHSQRLADTAVLKLRPAHVHDKTLHRRAGGCLEILLDDVAGIDRRKIVLCRPAAGAGFRPYVLEAAFGEGLPVGVVVLDVDELRRVEVVAADIHRQVGAPIIRHARPDDLRAGLEALDFVRARAQRRLERRLGDVALLPAGVGAFPPMFRQHDKVADDLRQFAVALLVEAKFHLAVGDGDRFGDIGEVAGICGLLALRKLKDQITSSAVIGLPSCHLARGIEPVGGGGIVVRIFEGFGDQRMAGARLVQSPAPSAYRKAGRRRATLGRRPASRAR